MRRLARPKKNKETNTDDLISQLIEAITATYLNPPENTADEKGHMYLNLLAEEFSMTPIKVRKLLISSGVYQTDISMRINELYKSGKTIKEIQKIVGLSAASVSGYLPYQKTVYNLEVSTDVANRLRKYRNRKAIKKKPCLHSRSRMPSKWNLRVGSSVIRSAEPSLLRNITQGSTAAVPVSMTEAISRSRA